MQEINKKYYNLQQLLLSIDPTNEWVLKLKDTPCDLFLITIKTKINNMNVNTMYDELKTKSNIDPKLLEPNEERLKRYLEYFTEIAKIV